MIQVPVSAGELLDKLCILEIKKERIGDPAKVRNVEIELLALAAVRDREITQSDELTELTKRLKKVNQDLWEIEDDIRVLERKKEFESAFIALARSVYVKNDERSNIKREINSLLGSALIEEKSYDPY